MKETHQCRYVNCEVFRIGAIAIDEFPTFKKSPTLSCKKHKSVTITELSDVKTGKTNCLLIIIRYQTADST